MSETTRLLLIRHAEPWPAVSGRCYGSLDVGLSEQGLRQAEAIARKLQPVALSAVYSSPRRRALQSAEPLARLQGLTPIVEEALRELDFGELEGRTYHEIEATDPGLYRAWMETPTLVTFPGGENYAALRLRVLSAVEAIRAAHPGETIAVVAHGGVLRSILADCLAMPDEAIFRLDQSYGGISIVDWLDAVPVVRMLNGQVSSSTSTRQGSAAVVGNRAGP